MAQEASSVDKLPGETELDALRRHLAGMKEENARLKVLISYDESTNIDQELPMLESLRRMHSARSSCYSITNSERHAMYKILRKFDATPPCTPDKKGAPGERMPYGKRLVNVKELQELYASLGEPLTNEEAEQCITRIKSKIPGMATFDEFLEWWITDHDRPSRYTTMFKLEAKYGVTNEIDPSKVKAVGVGQVGTFAYRVRFMYPDANGDMVEISPWHDIPLYPDGPDKNVVNFICEIPKWTRAKYEIAPGEPLNPIKQDIKNGKLRYYKHGDMMFNYGALPQTWEDPKHITEELGTIGDNDPIDALEVGIKRMTTGEIAPCKVLGVLALIDDGETDWKLILLRMDDIMADSVNSLEDLERLQPGTVDAIRVYLRDYKVCTGGQPNKYGFDGEAKGIEYSLQQIADTHTFWRNLLKSGKTVVDHN